MSELKKMTTCAMLIACAAVLSILSKMIPAPWLQGGSVTIASMVPIIIAGLIFGTKYGMFTALTYAILQMIPPFGGFYPPPVQNFTSFVLVVMLDYVIAYGILGLSGTISKLFGKLSLCYAISGFITVSLRYICHILSGIIIWGVYAPRGQTVLYYSIFYNGSYMIPEIIITTVCLGLLTPVINRLKRQL